MKELNHDQLRFIFLANFVLDVCTTSEDAVALLSSLYDGVLVQLDVFLVAGKISISCEQPVINLVGTKEVFEEYSTKYLESIGVYEVLDGRST